MSDRLLVIGGNAAGMSCASQARRLRKPGDLEIVVVEAGQIVSYSNCGIPYWVGGQVEDSEALVVRTPAAFADQDIDVRLGTRAERVDLDAATVTVRDGDAGRRSAIAYDQLLIATGSAPLRPPVEGLDAEGVFGVQTIPDGEAIRRALDKQPKRAVVLGGGYIGLEMAEALVNRGLSVTVVLADPLPMASLDEDMGERVCAAMTRMGIDVRTCEPVRGVEVENGLARAVITDEGSYPADLVVLGLGVRPNSDLAEDAGLRIGAAKGIEVHDTMRTPTHENVYAAGDCIQSRNRITGRYMAIALGTHANRQGRVAGTNIGGRPARFEGVLGTAVTKVGNCEIGRTGLSSKEAEQAGFSIEATMLESTVRAGYYPDAGELAVKLLTEKHTQRMLGAQIVGGPGSAKRIDVLATAIWAQLTAAEFADVDISYAPPFSPTFDPVVLVARKAAGR
ncbi:FAD-dependent oxidoreductase [soil metagenome]|jgi:NADPH-dependent 2,4-dienoyl-CoA reductase/sulfur reductase-like enzyme